MEQVKKLREMTGAGVMDCKKALEASDGDLEKAIDFLRHKGIASASRREDRQAKEGLISLEVAADKAAMTELNCETDFVARTDDFQKLAADLVVKVFQSGEKVLKDEAVLDRVRELSGKVGEKMVLTRGVLMEQKGGFVSGYLHSNKKIGVLVAVEGPAGNEQVQRFGKDVAMQIAASRASFVSRQDIPAEMLEREKELFRGEIPNKPKEIQEKIITGKIEKWFEDICLLDQAFIKDQNQKVKDYLAQASKASGQPIVVRRFVRFELGK